MNTEITDNNAETAGWVFYDGTCELCRTGVRRLERGLTRQRLLMRPLQSKEAAERLGLKGTEPMREMKLLLADGRTLGGADAVLEIARHIWWLWPLWASGRLPGTRTIIHAVYRVIAANRHGANGRCALPRRNRGRAWLPLLLLPLLVMIFREAMPDWVFMWALAFAIFLGCKWLTFCQATARHGLPPAGRTAAYLLAWPGMDGATFLFGRGAPKPPVRDWLATGLTILTGGGLLGCAVGLPELMPPLLRGWMGMAGIILMLHFGLFRLLALVWQAAGLAAQPLMNRPLAATSLAEFWGRRWNTAFHTLMHQAMFRPLARPLGLAWTTMLIFLASGLIHDLVISLPARGGYGWPTVYFLLQGTVVLMERSAWGRALGLGRGVRGWGFMLGCTSVPAMLLFHGPFLHHIILPMLDAFGALGRIL